MTRSAQEAAEALARQRFIILNAVRFGGIATLMFGLAIARGLIGLPWVVGVVLAVTGLLEFFFLPRFIARAWKAKAGRRE
ncbi:hypothetical protein [Erythrobacter sanguineus]|uniref:Uncharacterized protein n=1 Tax=Erythrobacter sanguineus TaxID=198312 RepID=A0A1M7RZ81_9SPHN|nr:hypothetical protein [Erythrobacter sanguineus]SHN51372.1 hypothetical protein SAMN02745193_00647 [Erythrobacter sanguineus]